MAAWSRSPMMTTLVGGLALFVPVVFIKPGSAGVPGVLAAALTIGLTLMVYLATVRGGAAVQIRAIFLAIGALAVDWIAFDWYWAVPLVIVAASIGVGLGERHAA